MALWTPYADDIALDLSKTSQKDLPPDTSSYPVTQYPSYHGLSLTHPAAVSPSYAAVSPAYPVPVSPAYPPVSPSHPVYHYGYVPVPQMSPLSAASVSSYERSFTPQPTEHFPLQPRVLSPPMSPQSQKRPHSMIDDSLSDDPDFQAFERDSLRAMAEKNGGALLSNNPRMRRSVQSKNESNDDSYRKQRDRNNYAAKQSRDRRKLREIHLALKVTYLKKEVASLKALLASKVCSRCQGNCRC